jgi:hypothetical protein
MTWVAFNPDLVRVLYGKATTMDPEALRIPYWPISADIDDIVDLDFVRPDDLGRHGDYVSSD